MSEQLNKLAADFFARNPGKDVVYAASDGALFTGTSARRWYAKQKNVTTSEIYRKDIEQPEQSAEQPRKEEKKSRSKKKKSE